VCVCNCFPPGGRLREGPFSIDPKSGIITLIDSLDKARVSYVLNVTATDNGRCCGGTTSRTSRGVVVIEIKDINNNAPKFLDCASYKPIVMEKENVGTSVIQVKERR
jgi:Cadherin domain